ncbi:MAG: TonB-dependent receptor plug domain-containing protein [Desulfobacteraceae bacterium]|nr:TonB-dependent receptor plug domain-containing protein [Desulfobacteraceae bacterium]
MSKNINRKETDSGGMVRKSKVLISPVLLPLLMVLILLSGSPLLAFDTMLMFVGEDLEVLSLASRREEAAWKAPAIAEVVTREKIENAGDATIADILGKSTGFYVNESERESVPYLRGIPDSVLFLYDTVPIGSAANKSYHNIDNEIFLAPIKRIEIVRGAGSVLWGPDAFAGVVNAVPLTGKDFQGVESGIGMASLDEARSAFIKYGVDKGRWDSFVSVSAKAAQEDEGSFNVVRFWNDGGDPSPLEERFGNDTPGDSKYYELYSSMSFDDWFTLSARVSGNNKIYTVSDWSGDLVWKEERSNPTQIIKLEASRSTGVDSGIRFTGYYTNNEVNLDIIGKAFDQSERSFYGELIYDRSMFAGDGLLTAGASWRKTTFKDIVVWNDFLPDLLDKENIDLLPQTQTEDYENNLGSVFGQYRHKFTNFELWAGVRSDAHDRFEDKVSYSLGAAWNLFPDLIFKAIHGTAYRTPFTRQLAYDDVYSHLERIESTNFQIAWKPEEKGKVALTLFRNGIDNHVLEERDLGVGFSTPNSQTILGAELEWDFRITENLSVSGNITALDNSGPDETYTYGRYYIKDPSTGAFKLESFKTENYDYNVGVDTMVNLALNWNLTPNITFVPELRYFSEAQLHYLHENKADIHAPVKKITMECSDVWLMDMHLKINDVFPFCVDFFVENLFNEHYETPGLNSLKEGKSFNAGVLVRMKW